MIKNERVYRIQSALDCLFLSSLGETVKKFIGVVTVRSAMTVGNWTETEGFERTQTMDPVDKVNMRPMLDT